MKRILLIVVSVIVVFVGGPQLASSKPNSKSFIPWNYSRDCEPPKSAKAQDWCATARTNELSDQANTENRRANELARIGINNDATGLTVSIIAQIAAAIFSASSVGGLIWSLILGRRSAKAAEDSAVAAIQAAKSAGDILKAERAWMTCLVPDAMWSGGIAGAMPINAELQPVLQWENSGRSPAINVRSVTTFAYVSSGKGVPNFSRIPNLDFGMPLGAGKFFSPALSKIPTNVTIAVLNGSFELFAHSKITYESIFEPGVERSTEICFQLSPFLLIQPASQGKISCNVIAVPKFTSIS